jgi:hypothetical protein
MQQCAVKRGMVSPFAVSNLGLKQFSTETVFQHIQKVKVSESLKTIYSVFPKN